MRDLDQLRERADDATGRKLGLFALAGTLSVAVAIALGVFAGGSGERAPDAALDPLAQLSLNGAEPAPQATERAPALELDTLSFPRTLAGEESAVEATVRAAEAEHSALSARTQRGAQARSRAAAAPARELPARTLASEQAERLQQVAKHDPLVAQALPERANGGYAPYGSEGAFTLQVVSFDAREPAQRFANALRARGHKAYVTEADVPGRGRSFRVRVGPFTTRREAEEYQTRFEQGERMHTILVANASK